ncbi:hypothetical protein GSI_12614 [Ganoderma sinense ZZ0214-1]|uniref:F-box domain-containing protein n=1 Tax=Ganoderma sinense ZZ0214-1 TaxID=1077348 RepID=A0A2G8RTR4_9APHY|nr:hypothetical protein GSI_12614 [Ganoderma sinense ZZ0214-1]
MSTSELIPRPHWALSCHDILCTIFEQFVVAEDKWSDYDTSIGDANSWFARRADASRRRTLARCARVCKAFFAPAITVLWRDIDNLSPLLTAMRSSLRSAAAAPMVFEQRMRVSEYARHIRAVHGLGKPSQAPEQDFSALEGWMEAAPLLPQLQRMRWVQAVPSGTELLHLVPSSLHSLHIIFRKSPTWSDSDSVSLHGQPSKYELYVRSLLKEVTARIPKLRYLRVSTTGDIPESWLEPLCSLSSLENVDLLERIYSEVMTAPLLGPLASLRNLQTLKLRLPIDLPSNMERDGFPTLESLILDTMFAPLRTVSTFLSTITSQRLSSLLIQGCECTTDAVTSSLYDTCDVVRTRFASSLRTFELSLRGVGPPGAHHQPLVRAIEPLLDLHDLRDVCISIAPEVAVVPASEHDLERMAEAWPRATRLHLAYFPSAASPSLKDIAGFAQHCLGLTDLVLPGIDASAATAGIENLKQAPLAAAHSDSKEGAEAMEVEDAGNEPEKAPHGLRSLCLSDSGWNSYIPDPLLLAKFLDALFPEVEWKCPPLASEHWRETIQEVMNLRIMRLVSQRVRPSKR